MGTIVRGKIIRDDLALFDGVASTYTRPNTSGATTGLKLNDFVDVLQVFGGGTLRTVSTIDSALKYIGTTSCCLHFDPGTWTIDSNVTIPSTISCHVAAGCVFAVSSGITLAFSGPVYVENPTWFSGDGTVTHALGAQGFPGY